MSNLNNNDDCQHDKYCGLTKTVCSDSDSDFKDRCLMKDVPIEEMNLLKKVKERVQRDEERKGHSA